MLYFYGSMSGQKYSGIWNKIRCYTDTACSTCTIFTVIYGCAGDDAKNLCCFDFCLACTLHLPSNGNGSHCISSHQPTLDVAFLFVWIGIAAVSIHLFKEIFCRQQTAFVGAILLYLAAHICDRNKFTLTLWHRFCALWHFVLCLKSKQISHYWCADLLLIFFFTLLLYSLYRRLL